MKTLLSISDLNYVGHPFFNCVKTANKISEPVRKYFGVSNFFFIKIFKDNSMIFVLNNAAHYIPYFYNKLYNKDSLYHKLNKIQQPLYSSCEDSEGELGFDIINPVADGWECYRFSSSKGSNNFKVLSLPEVLMLYKFIKSNAARFHKLLLKLTPYKICSGDFKPILNDEEIIKFPIKDKVGFYSELYNCKLSEREYQYAYLLGKGYSAKEIALELDLSYRTVEEYIRALKLKTKCSSTANLIQKFID